MDCSAAGLQHERFAAAIELAFERTALVFADARDRQFGIHSAAICLRVYVERRPFVQPHRDIASRGLDPRIARRLIRQRRRD